MAYNISTMYIWRNFNGECECPMCKIHQKTECDICDSYLSEAAMEDAEREKVNKYGFCAKHYDVLYSGRGKLPLALQASTRLKTMEKLIKSTPDVKKAVKVAESLRKDTTDCIICRKIEFNMSRYFETVARLYGDDEKFRKAMLTVKGFCFPHFIRLVENSKKAGKHAQEFIDVIYQKQRESLENLGKDLTDFTMAFDYRSSALPSKSASMSLVKTYVKMYGDKPILPERK